MVAPLRILCILFGCCLLGTQSGCISLSALMGQNRKSTLDTTLLKAQGYSIPPGGMPSPVAANHSGAPRIVMEVRGEDQHLESIPMPSDRAMFIEDLVQEAKLHEHFGKLRISIMRFNGEGAPPIRLEVQTDSKGKATSVGNNYALLPNDHVIVISDQRSAFEKFIEKRFGS